MLFLFLKTARTAILFAAISAPPVTAQAVIVKGAKERTAIPKACESVVPANIEGQIDIKALVKEADCKGSGDMVFDYTYVLKSFKKKRSNKNETKEETAVYEVFMPTMQSGTHGRGVLLVTSRDGVPVPADELEKERLRAGKQLEKEEKKAASTSVPEPQTTVIPKGMLPLGSYSTFGFGHSSSAVINIHTFLTNCDLTLSRREQNEGREILVFSFTPRPDAQFQDSEKYILQLKGEIWIDAKDKVVTRVVGWPPSEKVANELDLSTQLNERPPAIYIEMMRVPEGIWLPLAVRINGLDYPKLFDRVPHNGALTCTEYKRFTTNVKEVKIETPVPNN